MAESGEKSAELDTIDFDTELMEATRLPDVLSVYGRLNKETITLDLYQNKVALRLLDLVDPPYEMAIEFFKMASESRNARIISKAVGSTNSSLASNVDRMIRNLK